MREFWPLAQARARETDNLGACLAQRVISSKAAGECRRWKCRRAAFASCRPFIGSRPTCWRHLPRLWGIYNAAVAQYRRAYRLRSANHPVPDLARDGEWLEAPFWLWTSAAPKRRRLFAREQGDRLLVTDRAGLEIELPPSPDADLSRAVDVLADLPARGIKLRTRALLTTLFGRLLLSDLFMHGIGGGKYDELTDLLIARFFGLEPPGFLVLSGTLHLPVDAAERHGQTTCGRSTNCFASWNFIPTAGSNRRPPARVRRRKPSVIGPRTNGSGSTQPRRR